MTSVEPLYQMTKDLVDVAMGRKAASLVIRNGRWINVHSGEIIPRTDLAVCRSRIAYVGTDAGHTIGQDTAVIDAENRFLIPGFCDGHVHVESAMLTVSEFVRAVMVHGTTSIFIDPHEIANVLGLQGVRLMHDEAATLPINVFVQVPSCVPSAPGLETPGAELGPAEVTEALTWPGVIGLGEVMNFPGVAANDEKMHAEIAAAVKAGKTVGGHYASPDLGRAFHGYVAGGAADDHEGTRLEDALARVRRGMRPMLRYGSGWRDVAAQIKAITELGIDSRQFILCTDDCHAETLVSNGHMNRVLRHAIAQGLNAVTAIQMATLNTAQHFGLEREIGSLAPGRLADIVISSNMDTLPIEEVIAAGVQIVENGQCRAVIPDYPYPGYARDTVRLKRPIEPDDFKINAPDWADDFVTTRVIGIVEHQAPTMADAAQLAVRNGRVQMDTQQDVCQVAVVERHGHSGRVANGFVRGFGFGPDCAVATTVAHDCHQMLVVGTTAIEMAAAANRLATVGGGIAVYHRGREAALLALPIAGLMSDQKAAVVARQMDRVAAAMTECGCQVENAFMQLSLLALVVIPELRLSDLGLVDVQRFELTPLFVPPEK